MQEYLERNEADEIDIVNLFELNPVPEKDGCDKKGIPHLHAMFNGVPVVLRLINENFSPTANITDQQRDVIIISSSAELIVDRLDNKSKNRVS